MKEEKEIETEANEDREESMEGNKSIKRKKE